MEYLQNASAHRVRELNNHISAIAKEIEKSGQ